MICFVLLLLRLIFRNTFNPNFALRNKMLHFIQSLQYYLLYEVIVPSWQSFTENLKTVLPSFSCLLYHFALNLF